MASIDTTLGMGQIMDSLATETWPNLRLLLADLYLSLGEYNDAQDIWDSIAPYNEEVRQHLALRQISKVFSEQGYGWTELDSTESEASSFKNDIEAIAATNTVAGVEARNVLYLLTGEQDTLEYRLKEVSSPKMDSEEHNTSANEAITEGSFRLYPNPAMQQLTVEYGLKEGEDVKLYIYDLVGVLHTAKGLHKERMLVEIGMLNSGVYLVLLEVNGKPVQKTKLVIMK